MYGYTIQVVSTVWLIHTTGRMASHTCPRLITCEETVTQSRNHPPVRAMHSLMKKLPQIHAKLPQNNG